MRNFKLTYPAAPTLSIDLYRAIKGAKDDKPSGGGIAAGEQGIVVGPTPPENPYINQLWLRTP